MTLDEMARLHHACFAHLRAWPAQEIAEILDNPHSFARHRTGGFLLGRSLAGEAEMITLAVDPALRRRGIGSELVQEFLQTAQQTGAETAFLEVASDNGAAIALYQAHGFVQTGLRRGYYRTALGRAVDAVVMSCPLSQQARKI